MGRFEDYISSHITPQMTLLEKLNEIIKFLKTENQFNVFFSSQKWMDNIIEYNIEDVNTGNYELEINDVVIFTNGYYSYVRTLGNGKFTLGDLYFFVGEKGETGTGISSMSFNAQRHLIVNYDNGNSVDLGLIKGVSSFSINSSQHLIVNYDNGTTEDLGAIFNGNINIDGNFTANSIIENMSGYSFITTSTDAVFTLTYVGVVKNGNKLTLVIAGQMTLDSSINPGNYKQFGTFVVPSSVGALIYPNMSSDRVGPTIVPVSSGVQNIAVHGGFLSKYSNTNFGCYFSPVSTISVGTYYLRYEATFLLNDSLVS